MENASSPAAPDHLPEGTGIDVWTIALDGLDGCADRLGNCLSSDEVRRRDRLADADSRRRWAVGRAALRHLIARRLDVDPATLVIHRGRLGKPHLHGGHGIDFSISHSRGLALIGIASADIGVDVEHDRTLHHMLRTARRIFHADTVAHMLALPPRDRPGAFLDAWTLREAHVKAVGGGLFHTPDTLPYEPALPCDGSVAQVQERDSHAVWSLARLRPGPDAHATIAVRGATASLRIHDVDTTRQILEELA